MAATDGSGYGDTRHDRRQRGTGFGRAGRPRRGRTATAITAGARTPAPCSTTAGCAAGASASTAGSATADARPDIGDDETPGDPPARCTSARAAPPTAISAGDCHTCALLDDGNVRCWGYGADRPARLRRTRGNVGDDETPDLHRAGRTSAPAAPPPRSPPATRTPARVLDDGTVRCWGFGGNGRLGYGEHRQHRRQRDPGRGRAGRPRRRAHGAVAISAGDRPHLRACSTTAACAAGARARNGQLGYAQHARRSATTRRPAAAGRSTSARGAARSRSPPGGDHTCARLDDDSVRCWGRGVDGGLGLCSRRHIGDDEPPPAGPVDLGVPGVPAAACVAAGAASAAAPRSRRRHRRRRAADPSIARRRAPRSRRAAGLRACRPSASDTRRARSAPRAPALAGAAREHARCARRSTAAAPAAPSVPASATAARPGASRSSTRARVSTTAIVLTLQRRGHRRSRTAGRAHATSSSSRGARSAARATSPRPDAVRRALPLRRSQTSAPSSRSRSPTCARAPPTTTRSRRATTSPAASGRRLDRHGAHPMMAAVAAAMARPYGGSPWVAGSPLGSTPVASSPRFHSGIGVAIPARGT